MKKLGIGSKTFLLVLFVLSLLAALLLPKDMASMVGGFEIPEAFHIALVGFLTLLITEGLKDRFPQIAGALAVLISASVATLVSFVTGLINTGVDPLFYPMLTQAFLLIAAWLSSWGAYRFLKKPTTVTENVNAT